MRHAWFPLVLALVLPACEPGAGPARAPSGAPEQGPARRPAWLTPYDARQRALLDAQPHVPVSVVAEPVYPALRGFAYLLPDAYSAAGARRAARLVVRTAKRSSRLYILADADARDANPEALYGPTPPDDADPWVRAERGDDGAYRLAWAAPSGAAREAVDRARRALAAGDGDVATRALERAVTIAPDLPGAWSLLAEVCAAEHDADHAEQAAWRALELDPRSPAAARALAAARLARGDRRGARFAVARALAMYPASPASWKLAARITRIVPRPHVPPIFVEVGTSGAVVVASESGAGPDAYALCHATFRHEPSLRARFGLEGDYDLSQVEEQLCLEALLGAEPRGHDALRSLAREGDLSAYALFEVIGRRRPEWLRVAPDRVHRLVVRYVEHHVLAELER